MTHRRMWFGVGLALACLLALPTAARAQSSIYGVAKDESGGVLPGVTVEVSSPALIEGTKSATTDGEGNYRIVDLRPGQYTVKFTLTGFATVERAAFQLLTDFNAKIDATMKVGALAETITVTGAAPIVDVQSAAKVAVLDRDAIDNIPTGKTIQGLGQLILGVSLNAPDVGGSAGAMQTYMSLHGTTVSAANNTVMVDGMVINGLMLDGAVQTYTNDGDFQEMTYQTAGIDASRSGGGVTLNLVPKEGGNRFSGTATGLYRPDYLQASNYSDRFVKWGLPRQRIPTKDPVTGPFTGDPAINRIKRITDFNGSEGGPIMKDKLWFFVSGRDFQPINTVPNTFLDDGNQGIDDNFIRNALVRLTYQMSPKHKLGAYYERVFKWRGHDMSAFQDPETVAVIWTSPNYSTMSVKYTGTLSSKLLVTGGFSQNTEYYRNLSQPAVDFGRQNDAVPTSLNSTLQTGPWYEFTSHSGTGGGVGFYPGGGTSSQFPVSKVYQGDVSYVTGAHHAKAGFSYKNGKFAHSNDTTGDLFVQYPSFNRVAAENYNIYFPDAIGSNTGTNMTAARYAELFPTVNPDGSTNAANVALLANGRGATGGPCTQGTPTGTVASQSLCTVSIFSSPRIYQESLNYDAAVFLQDSYTLKRLTVNAGLRYEWFNSQVDYTTSGAGRFVPSRTSSATNLPNGGKDIPNWKDWAPRFQAVYDLFGNSKTAIKYSWNRYNESVTTSVAGAFNPFGANTSTRNWTDLNNDGIVQGGTFFDNSAAASATTAVVNGVAVPTYSTGTAITLADGSTTYRHFCTYLVPGCEINLTGAAGGQTAIDPQYGLLASAATFTQFPRRYHIEQGIEIQHALMPRLSLNGTFYHGVYHNFTQTLNWNTRDYSTFGTTNAQYAPVTVFSPIDGTPYLYYNNTATIPVDNHTTQDTKRTQTYDAWTAEFRMRPYAGAQLTGGIDFERTLNYGCQSSQTRTAAADAANITSGVATWQLTQAEGSAAVLSPNSLRFCDDRNSVQWAGQLGSATGSPSDVALYNATTLLVNGVQVSALPAQGKPFQKNFKLSGSFPVVFGMNFGVSYQNIDSGTISPSYRYGTAFKYPDGTSSFTSLTKSTTLPACPATYGCVPGGITTALYSVNPGGNFSTGAGGTTIASFDAAQYADERIVQLDLKLSKNLRFGRVSIQPTLEAFNVLNVDAVRSRLSTEYNVAAGTYLTPNNMLQGRIIGFGANVKW